MFNFVANIGPCNYHLVLKQCLSFSQSINPIICSSSAQTGCSFEQIQSVSKSRIHVHIFSSTEVRISSGNLCHLIAGYTKCSQPKIEFVQTTGQAVMHASHWLKLEHCLSTSWRLKGPLLLAKGVTGCIYETAEKHLISKLLPVSLKQIQKFLHFYFKTRKFHWFKTLTPWAKLVGQLGVNQGVDDQAWNWLIDVHNINKTLKFNLDSQLWNAIWVRKICYMVEKQQWF